MSAAGAEEPRRPGTSADADYEALLAGRPEATFFHTRAWARIVTAAFPQLRDASQILRTRGAAFALPLFRWRRLGGLLTTWHSSFPFLYGGPVPANEEAWRALAAVLPRLRGSVVLIGNPFTAGREAPRGASPLEPALRRGAETTHLLTLPESVEAYWRDVLTTRKRNDIRRLTRKGVAVETSTAPADLAAVYRLYQRRMAAWTQRPQLVYPLKLYQQMIARGGGAARCYVARFEERVIGGTFVIRWNGIVHYNAGYFDDRARALRPNVLIQERIIRDAIEDRFRIYDMLPSAGLAKVAAFKESFGGRPVPLARWERLGRSHRWRLALRRRRPGGGNRDDDD